MCGIEQTGARRDPRLSAMTIAAIVLHATPPGRVSRPSLNGAGDDAGHEPVRCTSCALQHRCLPSGLQGEALAAFSQAVYTQRGLAPGEALYHSGDEFTSIYAVRTGFLKSTVGLADGRDQVTGFHMPGEVIGMDGIGAERHSTDVIALEESDVCVIPYARLEEARMQRQLHKAMSRELVNDHGAMLLLGTMRAEERLAAFLLDLSDRFVHSGLPARDFQLCMSREEIGSYLGLRFETVSRLFSRFHDEGLVTVRQRHLKIRDTAGLKALMGKAGRR
jgi:CRP/FNR family transcriptional regulator